MERSPSALVLSALVAVTSFTACSKPAPDVCLAPSVIDEGAPVVRLGVHFVAGSSLLIAGNEVTSSRGVTVRPTKARFFLSQPVLIDESDRRVAAELVDDAGVRLPYGVTLIDFERPESMSLSLRAPAGRYRALSLSIGVPATCETGERLNHSDASAMKWPLDVDSDMYWSWNPGYVFLKYEGQLSTGSEQARFFYHVGADERFATVELAHDLTIGADGGAGPELIADFDRLLTAATGEARPDLLDANQRGVHGGELADALADNIRRSGFLRLAPAHH
jgi:hypothetical protein